MKEYLVVVDRDSRGLVARGRVDRDLAHTERRVLHTSVLILPLFSGTQDVLLHQRPGRVIGAGKWDFAGGHVRFEPDVLSDPSALERCIDRTAVREAQEELRVTIAGHPYEVEERSVRRLTDYGDLVADEPRNLEYSTGYACFLPPESEAIIEEEDLEGRSRPLPTMRRALSEVRAEFARDPDVFADGARRLLGVKDLQQRLDRASRSG